MKISYAVLALFFLNNTLCLADDFKSYDALAEALSSNTAPWLIKKDTYSKNKIVMDRDPFQPLVDESGNILATSPSSGTMAVQGIVDSGTSTSVLINDKFYTVGDTIEGYRILKIRPEGVTVQDEKGSSFLPLYPDSSTN